MKKHNGHPFKMTKLTSSQKCIFWRLQLFDIFSPEHEIKWTKARSINTWQENISQMKKKNTTCLFSGYPNEVQQRNHCESRISI